MSGSKKVVALAMAVCAPLIAVCPAWAAANLVINPGFESGSAGWNFTGAGSVHGVDGQDPSHSGNVEAYINAYPGYGTISQSIATTPGQTYLAAFWVASNGGNGNIYTDFGSTQGFNMYNPGGFYSYIEYSYTAVATDANTAFYIGGYGITATFFFDDVSITSLLPGDADGDGIITINDFLAIDYGFIHNLHGYANGDFNGDGTIDAADFAIVDAAYRAQVGSQAASEISLHTAEFGQAYTDALQAIVPVPEPASIALLGLSTTPFLIRRRRRVEERGRRRRP